MSNKILTKKESLLTQLLSINDLLIEFQNNPQVLYNLKLRKNSILTQLHKIIIGTNSPFPPPTPSYF